MKNFLSGFIVVLFVPVFIFTVLSWNLRTTVLNNEFVKEQLVKQDFYEFIHDEAFGSVLEIIKEDGSNVGEESGIFTNKEIVLLMQDSLSEEYLQGQIENSVDSVYSYLLSEEESLKIEINLTQVKSPFKSGFIKLAKKRVGKLPKCTTTEEFSLNKEGVIDDIDCIPPGVSANEIVSNLSLSTVVSGLSKNIPSKITITDEGITTQPPDANFLSGDGDPPPEFVNTIKGSREAISWFILASNISIATLIALLLLLTALRVWSYKSMAKWLGWAIAIPSSLLLIFPLITNQLLLKQLSGFTSSQVSMGIDSRIQKTAETFVTYLIGDNQNLGLLLSAIKEYNQQIIFQMILVFFASLVLIVGSHFLRKKTDQTKP